MPIAHIGLTVSDMKASRAFYLSALAPLGYKVYKESEAFVGFAKRAPDFWLFPAKPDEGKLAPVHIAFEGSSRKVVDQFHAAALAAGAKCNGPPGERPQYIAGYYGAYVLDSDGNNIECVHWNPWWLALLKQSPYILGGVVGVAAWFMGKKGII